LGPVPHHWRAGFDQLHQPLVFLCFHQEKVAANELLIRGKADAPEVWILRDGEKCVVPNGGELSTNGLEVLCCGESRDE